MAPADTGRPVHFFFLLSSILFLFSRTAFPAHLLLHISGVIVVLAVYCKPGRLALLAQSPTRVNVDELMRLDCLETPAIPSIRPVCPIPEAVRPTYWTGSQPFNNPLMLLALTGDRLTRRICLRFVDGSIPFLQRISHTCGFFSCSSCSSGPSPKLELSAQGLFIYHYESDQDPWRR